MAKGNQHGLHCPSCGHDDELWVSGTVTIQCARLMPNGADYDGGDLSWEDADSAGCTWCGWEATAGDLLDENEDGWEEVLAEVIRHYYEDQEIPGSYHAGDLPEYGDEDEGPVEGLVEDDVDVDTDD